MYIYVRVRDPLKMELQTAMSCYVCERWELNLRPLEEQSVLLTPERSLQITL